MMIYDVVINDKVAQQLWKIPRAIQFKLMAWVEAVKEQGLCEVRKIPGFHDEPLHGNRKGQRSIRLNRAYRAIYEVNAQHEVHFIEVKEVNKHEY